MLTGPALGDAVRRAMALKKVKQRHVAEEFGVSQPSVSEWLRFGRIDKKHLSHLVAYFSDVADFAHWGLPAEWGRAADAPAPVALPSDEQEARLVRAFRAVLDSDRASILAEVEQRAAYVAELAQMLASQRPSLRLAHETPTDERDRPIAFAQKADKKPHSSTGKKP